MSVLVRDVVRFDRWTAATAELTKPLKDFQTRHHTRRQTLVRSSTLFLFFEFYSYYFILFLSKLYFIEFCFLFRSRGQNKNNDKSNKEQCREVVVKAPVVEMAATSGFQFDDCREWGS